MHQSLGILWSFHNGNLVLCLRLLQVLIQRPVVVFTVAANFVQAALVFVAQQLEHFRSSSAVVNVGRSNQDDQEQTHGVYNDMTFAAVDLFAAVVAARATCLG